MGEVFIEEAWWIKGCRGFGSEEMMCCLILIGEGRYRSLLLKSRKGVGFDLGRGISCDVSDRDGVVVWYL